MRKLLTTLSLLAVIAAVQAQNEYEITVESKQPSGIIDEMLYGQLFEHIYFSANNGGARAVPRHPAARRLF